MLWLRCEDETRLTQLVELGVETARLGDIADDRKIGRGNCIKTTLPTHDKQQKTSSVTRKVIIRFQDEVELRRARGKQTTHAKTFHLRGIRDAYYQLLGLPLSLFRTLIIDSLPLIDGCLSGRQTTNYERMFYPCDGLDNKDRLITHTPLTHSIRTSHTLFQFTQRVN